MVLLIHGAGGSTHSWQHLIGYLAKSHRVVAVDLPGQGFTQLGAQRRCGLNAMSEDLIRLCTAENLCPGLVIGHSAGAAIALRMAEHIDIGHVIGINAALDTFHGLAGLLFPALAKTIAAMPMSASLFSATASHGNGVGRIIKGTGSTLPPGDLALYQRLVRSRGHVQATLQMMAQWELEPLLGRLPDMTTKTTLIAAAGDLAVPAQTSRKAANMMRNARFIMHPSLGHLAHEENAAAIADYIRDT